MRFDFLDTQTPPSDPNDDPPLWSQNTYQGLPLEEIPPVPFEQNPINQSTTPPPSEPVSNSPPDPFPSQPPPPRKSLAPLLIGIIVLFILLGAGGYVLVKSQQFSATQKLVTAPTSSQVACPQDAKVCPDGTAVGRVAPNCDFAPCPAGTQSATPAASVFTNPIASPLSVPNVSTIPANLNQPYTITYVYPPTWTVQTQRVTKGQNYTLVSGASFIPQYADGQVVTITKGTATVQIVAQRSADNSICGGEGPESNNNEFKTLNVLQRTAWRADYENGKFGFTANTNPNKPYPIVVLFKRNPGELAAQWPQPDTDSQVVRAFCATAPNTAAAVSITYASPTFTETAIKNKTVDAQLLAEMDTIAQSIGVE